MAFNQVDLTDWTYTIVTPTIWTTIEQSMGILCACLPPTRPLLGRFLRTLKRSTGHSTDRSKPSNTGAVPLTHYSSQRGLNSSKNMPRDGFSRLSEENNAGLGTVTAQTSAVPNVDLPIMSDRILMQQTLEQQVDYDVRS